MPHCKECAPMEVVFPTVKALALHLQLVHKLTVSSCYQCGEPGCFRKFTSLDTFKKHLRQVHVCSNNTALLSSTTFHNQQSMDIDGEGGASEMVEESSDVIHCSVEEFKSSLESQTAAFVSKLYSKASLPRNHVQSVIVDTKSFLSSGFLTIIKDKVLNTLSSTGTEAPAISEIEEMFQALENPFDHLRSEHIRFKYFTQSGAYIPPESYELGKRLQRIVTENGVKAKWVSVTAEHISLPRVLTKFLELPDALSSILSYINSLNSDSDCLSNFVQGKLWNKKIANYSDSDIVLPLFVYFDDFEANNPLGSHSGKLGGVYVSIPCLPPECQSSLENIFVALLFHSSDREEFTNNKVLAPLLSDLKYLESHGVVVKTGDEERRVYFVLSLIIGDNLGIHQLCGFVGSFSANFACRFCKAKKDVMQRQIDSDLTLLRNEVNYEEDLILDDVSLTGVKARCEFNDIESFMITENWEGDPLHDLEEGVMHYVMILALNHFIIKKYFTLNILNFRIQMFDFGVHSSNVPPCISEDSLLKSKLKMTASEMLCFVRHFGVMIGDLVPEDDAYWHLYLSLQRVTDVVMSKCLPKTSITSFQVLVKELGCQYLSLKKKDNSSPHFTIKFHLLLCHYSVIMEQSGPVVHLSSKRYESKHRQHKLSANVNMSRVNIVHSLAVKHQLKMCHRFLANKSIIPSLEVGPGEQIILSDITYYGDIQDTLPTDIKNHGSAFMANWVEFKGTHYSARMVLLVGNSKELHWPLFGELKSVLIHQDDIVFVCRSLDTVGFNEHYHAFEVMYKAELFCIKHCNLTDPLPVYAHKSATGDLYVVLRY